MFGAKLSSTVTTAVPVAELPLSSVHVNVTLLFPTSVQVKTLGDTWETSRPQLSEEPLSISAAVNVYEPFASRLTVMSWVIITGSIKSTGVTDMVPVV